MDITAAPALGLRMLYAAAVLGAGSAGVLTLFVPQIASRYLFLGETVMDPYLRILGALWLALALVASLGFVHPERLVPILLVQLVYKSAWLAVVAFPALIAGTRTPGLMLFAALFTVWVGALVLVAPWRSLV